MRMRALAGAAELAVFVTDPSYPRTFGGGPRAFETRAPGRLIPVPRAEVGYVAYPVLPVITRGINGYVLGGRLLRRLRHYRPDVVLGYFVHPEGSAALHAARELGVPAVVCAVGSDLRRIPGRFSRYLTRKTLERASTVIAVSGDLVRCAIELGAPPDRTIRIVNGCDGGLFKPAARKAARAELGIPDSARMVLFAGHLVELKGLHELLAAFDVLSADRRAILAVLGSGPLRNAVSAAAERHCGRILAPGARPPEEVARWLAACDVVCLPSHSEGCPNIVIEALTCGRPVVASAVGGIPELVNSSNGVLVAPGDPPALAAALEGALSRQWDAQAIALDGGRTWADVARETVRACSGPIARTYVQAA